MKRFIINIKDEIEKILIYRVSKKIEVMYKDCNKISVYIDNYDDDCIKIEMSKIVLN